MEGGEKPCRRKRCMGFARLAHSGSGEEDGTGERELLAGGGSGNPVKRARGASRHREGAIKVGYLIAKQAFFLLF